MDCRTNRDDSSDKGMKGLREGGREMSGGEMRDEEEGRRGAKGMRIREGMGEGEEGSEGRRDGDEGVCSGEQYCGGAARGRRVGRQPATGRRTRGSIFIGGEERGAIVQLRVA